MTDILTVNVRNKWENRQIRRKNRKKSLSQAARKRPGRLSNSISHDWHDYHNIGSKQKRMINMKHARNICNDLTGGNNNMKDVIMSIKNNLIVVWTCSQCTYRNVERNVYCKICRYSYHKNIENATTLEQYEDFDGIDELYLDEEVSIASNAKVNSNVVNIAGKRQVATNNHMKHPIGFEAYIKHKNRDEINTDYGIISPYIEYLICYLRPILPTKKSVIKLIKKKFDRRAQIKLKCVMDQHYIKRFYHHFIDQDCSLLTETSEALKSMSKNNVVNSTIVDLDIVHSLLIPERHYNSVYFKDQKDVYANDNNIVKYFGQNLLVYGYIRRLYMEYYGFNWIVPNDINVLCLKYYNHDIKPIMKNNQTHPEYQDKMTYWDRWRFEKFQMEKKIIPSVKCFKIDNGRKNSEWQYNTWQYISLVFTHKGSYFSEFGSNITYERIIPIYHVYLERGKDYLSNVVEIEKWLAK